MGYMTTFSEMQMICSSLEQLLPSWTYKPRGESGPAARAAPLWSRRHCGTGSGGQVTPRATVLVKVLSPCCAHKAEERVISSRDHCRVKTCLHKSH